MKGRTSSNVYEVNTPAWLWQFKFGCDNPRLGGLTCEVTTKRQDSDAAACKVSDKRQKETHDSEGSKGDQRIAPDLK
jgi:hypothetical protein